VRRRKQCEKARNENISLALYVAEEDFCGRTEAGRKPQEEEEED